MSRHLAFLTCVLLALHALGLPASAQQCPAATHLQDDATGPSRTALVFSDPKLLSEAFSFSTVINRILESSGVEKTNENADALVKTMIDTFALKSQANGKLEMVIDERPEELKLVASELLRGADDKKLHPVGLFNRLDLAPQHWSNCGEYRIVFSRKPEATSPPKQFLVIFEAKLPSENVSEALSLSDRQARCEAVAKFWAELAKDTDKAAVVGKLSKFYFDGFSVGDGKTLAPVISAANLGSEQGQVRGNVFLGQPWQLREWRIQKSGGALSFVLDTVKSNPLADFYADAPAAGANPDEKTKRWRGFNNDFVGTHVRELLTPEFEDKAGNAVDLTANLGLNSADPINEFQSTSTAIDEPNAIAPPDSNLRKSIKTKLSQLGAKAAGLTDEHILNRAGAMTCGGCHRFSAGDKVSATTAWPNDLGFKHIDHDGNLSPALDTLFLRARMAVLKKVACGIFGTPAAVGTIPAAPSVERAAEEDADIVAMRALRVKMNTVEVVVGSPRASAQVEAEADDFGATIRSLERNAAGAFRTVRPVH